ncbi:MAG: alpha-ketoacid dehydrogenase subunit beta [Actinobacteria bacterium]|nr:alpha-ketoacid dehydrogenase subunit beta [Actinomycetota bacterium]
MSKLTYTQAITAALREELARDPRVFVMGEDVASNIVGYHPGFAEEFGRERVRDTPIAEAGFVGAAAGAAMVGMRPVVDMMIAPFMYVAFDQIVSIIAKATYLYGGQTKMPITIRAGMWHGASIAAQHSDRPMATLATIPGLKIVAPASPYDVKGLLKAAVRDDDPVVCLEAKRGWPTAQEIPDEEYVIPLGEAEVKREGADVTVVAVSSAVRAALDVADSLREDGISVEVVDPRTIVPLDIATILASVEKTGRLVVADPCHEMCSVASEVSATVAEHGFWNLRSPIARVTTPNTHIPFSPALEPGLYPTADRIAAAVHGVLAAASTR